MIHPSHQHMTKRPRGKTLNPQSSAPTWLQLSARTPYQATLAHSTYFPSVNPKHNNGMNRRVPTIATPAGPGPNELCLEVPIGELS
jgi:hypothetical protein